MDVQGRTLRMAMCHNEDFSPLARHCCRTLSNERIQIHKRIENVKSEGLRSPGWYRLTRLKVEMLRELLDTVPEGEIVGMTDCDIQFFSSDKILEVRDKMLGSGYDYVGLTEGCGHDKVGPLFGPGVHDTNTGFVLLRKCSSIFDFLDDVLTKSFEQRVLSDQGAINESLRSLRLNWALLNPYFFVHGCCGNPHRDMVLHHSTCTGNFSQKVDQINWARGKIGASPVVWDDPSFGNSCVAF